jgi:hypothetical protein
MNDSTATPAGGVPYENTAEPVWADQALDLWQQRDLQVETFVNPQGVVSAQVWGPCPRCRHDLIDAQPTLTTPIPGLREGRGLWATLTGRHTPDRQTPTVPKTVEVACGCRRNHPDAPQDILGCGVSFRLPTTPPATSTTSTAPTTQPNQQTTSDDPQGSR